MTPNPPIPNAPVGVRPPSSLPVVALVLSVVGIFCMPLMLVGIIIGIVALVQKKGSFGVALAAVIFPIAVLPVLAAIAIPNFIRFQARSKQVECKTNLKAAYFAEKSYFSEFNQYETTMSKAGFAPERGNRYLYVLTAEGKIAERDAAPSDSDVGFSADTARFPANTTERLRAGLPARLVDQLGVHGQCPKCEITIACAGNIDEDATIDVWSISTENRTSSTGEAIPAGVPFNEVNDVTD